ncbi:hypothetical protein N657DRAFT_650778 [Parathielavia appendiculata]|uniref:Replication termination factor 2 n=1 Tax=Parathielavia appendiculata TaxID=2587402 RepID=A0AAN6TRD3_9PEZI|nr:hypothetical protein N657DRAFT_650778 [Parathielavia appendiculata]
MGNDGGSIPTRRELVKSAARVPTVSELKATAFENLGHAWTHDPLTSEQLDLENVVSDWRGRLYSYESVLKGLMPSAADGANDDEATPALVNGESPPELTFASTGIKSLRDVVKLKFRRYASPGKEKEKWIWACPVTLKEMGPATKAVYLVPCGHVFAEAAIKEIYKKDEVCPGCSEPFQAGDVIPILPTEKADLDRLMARINDLKAKGLTHSLKKGKGNGRKKRKADEANGDRAANSDKPKDPPGPYVTSSVSLSKDGTSAKVHSESDISSRVSGINNAMTAGITAKVLAEQEERNKRRKLAASAR